MYGQLHVVERRWKKKYVQDLSPRISQGPHLDSLSQFVANTWNECFRKLYTVVRFLLTSLNTRLVIYYSQILQLFTIQFQTHLPEATVNERTFRLVSYNVLCQRSMDDNPGLYEHLPDYIPGMGGLDMWDKRWKLLKPELQSLQGDIYCLQEVEAEFFEHCFLSLFNSMGFQGVCTQREGRADACSIFWKKSKFTMIQTFDLNLNYHVSGLDKPNVAQIVVLKHNFTKKEVIVVNTHILFSPTRGDVKLNQLMVIFAQLRAVSF